MGVPRASRTKLVVCLAVFAWAGLLPGADSHPLRWQQQAAHAGPSSSLSMQQHNAQQQTSPMQVQALQQQLTAQVDAVLLRLRSSRASQSPASSAAAGAVVQHVQQHRTSSAGPAGAAHVHRQQHTHQHQQLHHQQHHQQQQQVSVQRSLLGFRPSPDEQDAASKHAAKLSGWHAGGVTLLCLMAMAVLGFMGYKAMQWYERVKRPGYVELQSLDNTFFRPTFTL